MLHVNLLNLTRANPVMLHVSPDKPRLLPSPPAWRVLFVVERFKMLIGVTHVTGVKFCSSKSFDVIIKTPTFDNQKLSQF
jgi:hypothetical protein